MTHNRMAIIANICHDRQYPLEALRLASINFSLTDEMRDFVLERGREEGFSTPSEYLRHLVREDRKRSAQEKLETLLLAGLTSGKAKTMTDEDWSKLRKTVRDQALKRKTK